MKVSTLSALIPLIPALHAFVIVNPHDEHAQRVFLSTSEQDVINDDIHTVIDASHKDPFWHPDVLVENDIDTDEDKYPYLSGLGNAISQSEASKDQSIWRQAADKLKGLKDDVMEAIYDEDEVSRYMYLNDII